MENKNGKSEEEKNETTTFTPSPCGLFKKNSLETPFCSPKIHGTSMNID